MLNKTKHELRTYAYTTDSNGCNVIIPGNASLAANWENIPETLILNGLIGILLFVSFLVLTCIAWRRVDSEDKLKNLNIVAFLYGYRDPEHWYLIPRFEFLRHEERHHQHDLNYAYLYAPPKLPLANPMEIFAKNDQDLEKSKSIDSSSDRPTIDLLKPADPLFSETTAQKAAAAAGGPKSPTRLHDAKAANKEAAAASASPPSPPPPQHATKTPSANQAHDVEPGIRPASLEVGTKSAGHLFHHSSSLGGGGGSNHAHGPQILSPGGGGAGAKDRRDTLKSGASFFYPSILTAEQLQASSLSRKLNRFFSSFFRITDADIIYARGIDAYEYLLFQRHLILILAITNVLCLGVILPVHWFGGDGTTVTSFQRSTIKNINSAEANLHWAHILCSAIIVGFALKIMSSYSDSIITPNDQQISRRTLLIGNIPVEQRTRAHLLRILKDSFPKHTIEAIQFVYDTNTLYDDEMYLSSTVVAKDYCQAYKRKHNREINVHRTDVNTSRVCDGYCRCCSFVYVGCCYWPYERTEPGSAYYAKEEEFYRDKIAKTCEKMVKEPAEFAFVTFKSHKQARRVMQELANLKQDVLEGKGLRLGSNRSPEQSPKSSRDATKPPRAAKASKFLEAGTRERNDPLDPKNNPHVRSIRSPSIKQLEKNQAAAAAAAATKAAGPGAGKQISSEHFSSSSWQSHLGEGPLMWSVRYAPHPDNVDFQDLLNLSRTSPLMIGFLHTLMIIIFIFITTPNVILSMIERISVLRPDKAVELTGFQGLMINYLSILLQIITTALLPAMITLISKQIPYEDSAAKGHAVMWKVYLFLVLMVIVMPSIGMSSALAFFDSKIDPKCLFPTDNGAYYINYVISSIFLSTMLELVKPIDILSYYFILWTSRSTAEIEGGRQFIEREFSVGIQHTGVLLIFSVVMTYSISCPLIAPVGLIYLMIKHCVDHYNLYYTYFTKKVDKDMQSTIVIFVRVALLLMLFQTTVAIYIHTGTGYFSLMSQVLFWITLAAFVFNCFFDCTSRAQPPNSKRARYQHDFCACFYLPKVISSLMRLSAIPASCISRKV